MATINKLPSGNWRAMVRRQDFYRSKTFPTKREASEWSRKIEVKLDADPFSMRSLDIAADTLLTDALDQYLREVTPGKKGAQQEKQRIRWWQKQPLAIKSLASIRSHDLTEHRDRRLAAGRAPSTVRNELNLISSVFKTARLEWGLTGLRNPVEDIRRPIPDNARERRLRDGEEALLVDNAQVEMAGLIVLALETGARLSELLGMRRRDIRGNVVILWDTKNGTRRDLPLSKRASATLKGLPSRLDGKVFPWSNKDDSGSAFRYLLGQVGIDDLTFHDLRHEGVSRLFEKGLGIQEVAAISGHRSWASLKRYTHPKATIIAKKLG